LLCQTVKPSSSTACDVGSQIEDKRLLGSLTPFRNAMRTSLKSRRQKAKANRAFAPVSSTVSVATKSLVNMIVTITVSGAVLLALLVARRF
jgi:hypothetical protein